MIPLGAGLGLAGKLLKRVPGMAWVVLFTACFLVAGWFGAVHHGEEKARVAIHRRALEDTVRHVQTEQATARAHADTVVAAGRTAVQRSDRERRATADARAHVLATIDSQPTLVVQLTEQVAHDSGTIALLVAGQGALLAERPIADTLDAARVRQLAVDAKPPPTHRWRHDVTLVAGTVAVIAVAPKVIALVARLFPR